MIPSPAPPSRRLDTGGEQSAVAPAAADRRGGLYIDMLDEAPDPWAWHVMGHQSYRVLRLEVHGGELGSLDFGRSSLALLEGHRQGLVDPWPGNDSLPEVGFEELGGVPPLALVRCGA